MDEYKPTPVRIENVIVTPSYVRGVRWLSSEVHQDSRGYFFEGYRESLHRALAGDFSVQTNISVSKPNVLRGFHWHRYQDDFWVIASGMAQVVVATRSHMDVESRVLAVGQGVIIPRHVAHGFLALSELVLIYNVTKEFDREDPDENGYSASQYSDWLLPLENTTRSKRDTDYDTNGGRYP